MTSDTTAAATAWLDRFFATLYHHRPVEATFVGIHDHDHRLPDLSEAGVSTFDTAMTTLVEDERLLDPAPVGSPEAHDRALAVGHLRSELLLSGTAHSSAGNPTVYSGQSLFGVLSLLRRPFAPASDRLANAIERMDRVPALLRVGESRLRVMPTGWIDRALADARGALALFDEGIAAFCRTHDLDAGPTDSVASAAADATARFGRFLEDARTRSTQRAAACGGPALDALFAWAHGIEGGSEEVERTAWARLEESRSGLQDATRRLGLGDANELAAALRENHPDRDSFLNRHTELFETHRAVAQEHALVTWPPYPLAFVETPRWLQGTMEHALVYPYHAPAPHDGDVPVEFLVPSLPADASDDETAQFLADRHDGVIKLNHVVHHGGIGHHVQNWYAYHAARSRIGRMAAVDSAGHTVLLCGMTMAEGWASYVPELMAEAGFLTEPEQASLYGDALRAATRAIVDVRLHTGRWTPDEAAVFLIEETGCGEAAAHAAVARLSLFPTSGSTYTMGSVGIRRLREELEEHDGQAFRLQSFHDALLGFGSIPVPLAAAALRP